ncbi:MAG: TolC family protein [Halobacteriovoraceae bacterium]|nr:TolC family protein [Halobacteriovoraceae bacterium]MCB9095273.1 TolC family protein [Halobacteriovoraceae bacterium]
MKYLSLLLFFISYSALSNESLTVEKFVQLIEKNDPEYLKIFSEDKKIENLIDSELPSRKWELSVSQEKGYSSDNNSDTSVLQGEITKEIIETGTALSVNHTKTRRPDRREDVTELRVEQNLLKNVFGRDVRLQKEGLKEQVSKEKLQLEERYEGYLQERLLLFLDYKKSFLDYKLAEQIHSEALKLKKNVYQKYRSKIATKTDFNRSELLVLLREEDLLSKKRVYNSRKNEIQNIVGETFLLDQPDISKEFVFNIGIDQLIKLQNKQTDLRDWKVVDLKEKIAQKDYTLSKRNRYPEVNFIAGFNRDDSSRFSSNINRDETVVGLELIVPLGDSQAKANEEIASVNLYQTEIEKRMIQNDWNRTCDETKTQLLHFKKVLDVDKKKILVTEKILKEEERRYGYGRIELDSLIEIKNDYASYRLQYQADLLEFNKYILTWLALNDKLVHYKEKYL